MPHAAPPHHHAHESKHKRHNHVRAPSMHELSVLAWPAWLRVLVILPLVLALWLAVWWANMGALPW